MAIIQSIATPRTILCRDSAKNVNRVKILATNLDQVLIILSAGNPETPSGLIDRMIVASISGGLEVVLCFNKIDQSNSFGLSLIDLYKNLPYPLLKISARTGDNLIELKKVIKGKKTILLGTSGVGKSTIIKTLTGLSLITSELNTFSGKGKHTTTISHLYKIDKTTYIADIPGIKQLGFIANKKIEVFFPEIEKSARGCKFSNCTHTKETSCQVKRDLENKVIDYRRYESYQKLLEETTHFK